MISNLFNPAKEKEFLNSLVRDYKDVSPYSQVKKEIIINEIQSFFKYPEKKRGLQLGCSNGYETGILSRHLMSLDVIDGSSVFIEKVRAENQFANVNYICSLFEEYASNSKEEQYDYVFCNYVLEHVFETSVVLQMIRKNIKSDGCFFAVVPNAFAFSRQWAMQMELIPDLKALTENDHRHGHRRVYDRQSFSADIQQAGFEIIACKGIIFKIFADFQLNKLLDSKFLSEEHILGLQKMGNIYPDFSDSILVVAKPG
jgi:2-polyprenyl-3-methyl-5-hydroxy-6-metoxy-1,4-benzoquinol methylase